MAKITDLITTQQITATSVWERIGDKLLTPESWLFGRKRISVLGLTKENVYELYPVRSGNVAWKIAGFFGLVLVPFGLLFKSVALLTSEKTRLAYGSKKISIIANYEASREMSTKALSDPELTKDFIVSVANNPSAYSSLQRRGLSEKHLQVLSFRECACSDGKFNRLLNNRRANIEAKIIEDIVSRVKDKNQQINILSLGSGELATEFILLGLLVKAGYNNIHFILVDRQYLPKIFAEDFQAGINPHYYDQSFLHLKEPLSQVGVTLQVDFFTNASDYLKSAHDSTLDVVMGVDIHLGDESEDTRIAKRERPSLTYEDLETYQVLEDDYEVPRRYLRHDVIELQNHLQDDGKIHLAYGNAYLSIDRHDNAKEKIERADRIAITKRISYFFHNLFRK